MLNEDCWKGYKQVGMKTKNGKQVPNCVPESVMEIEEDLRKWFGKGKTGGWDRYNTKGEKVGKCGDAKEGEPYVACLSNEKAAKLGKAGRAAFVKRKRAAQKDAGDATKGGEQKKGQKPTFVKTGVSEDWSEKYKSSIDCNNPKGFSQKAHCAGKQKNENMKLTVENKLNLFLEKNVPTDPEKWSYAKAQAKKKFDVYPSAYANGWAAKKYKELGGSWKKDESVNENLPKDGNKVYGGGGAKEGYRLIAQDGLKQILDLSKKNPSNVFFVRDDNYTNFGPYYVKNGKVAKYTVANPNYDFLKNQVKSLRVPKDVILKFTVVESVNEDCGCGNSNSYSLKELTINEGDYKFGEVEYTAKNMTPTTIQDLAYAYHQTPIGKLAGRSIDHRIRTARDLGRLVGKNPMNPTEKSNQPALLLHLHKKKLVNVEEYKELYNGLVDKLKKVSKYVKNADPASRKDAAVAKMAARADMREAKKYSIGSGYLGNGLTIWNRAEEKNGDYKTIAHISKSGELKIYDKQLPSDIRDMFQRWADTIKKGGRPELY